LNPLNAKGWFVLFKVGAKHRDRLPSFGGKLLDILATAIGALKTMVVGQQSGQVVQKRCATLKQWPEPLSGSIWRPSAAQRGRCALDLPEFEPSRFPNA